MAWICIYNKRVCSVTGKGRRFYMASVFFTKGVHVELWAVEGFSSECS